MTGYIFEHQGQQFAPEGKAKVASVEAHNASLEAAELAHWASKPDRFAAYVGDTDDQVCTWMGTRLGRIVSQRTYRNNMGARITSIRVRGTNGADYYGRYGADWSQLIRLRLAKGAR